MIEIAFTADGHIFTTVSNSRAQPASGKKANCYLTNDQIEPALDVAIGDAARIVEVADCCQLRHEKLRCLIASTCQFAIARTRIFFVVHFQIKFLSVFH